MSQVVPSLRHALGADDAIDYTHDEIDCNGARYDVVIDTAGNRPLSLLRRAMTPRGRLVLVGGERGGGRSSAASTGSSSGRRWSRCSRGSGCAA